MVTSRIPFSKRKVRGKKHHREAENAYMAYTWIHSHRNAFRITDPLWMKSFGQQWTRFQRIFILLLYDMVSGCRLFQTPQRLSHAWCSGEHTRQLDIYLQLIVLAFISLTTLSPFFFIYFESIIVVCTIMVTSHERPVYSTVSNANSKEISKLHLWSFVSTGHLRDRW